MAYLTNRNPPARVQCLHALCQLTQHKFPIQSDTFQMKEIKFDSGDVNIHQFCQILKKHQLIQYCPYKENPLDEAGCSLTNGVEVDTTKQKEISNTVNALHSLGFFFREGREISITKSGRDFASCSVNSEQYLRIFTDGLLKNGLMVGLLGQIYLNSQERFSTNDIYVGYPNTGQESVFINGERIIISSGSEKDSNTRTKSCLLAWGVTSNFFAPVDLIDKSFDDRIGYTLLKVRNKRHYEKIDFPDSIFDRKFITQKPLDYNNLTKNTGALRENNQEKIRKVTMQMESKIKNRRLAILHALNDAYHKQYELNLESLIDALKKFPDEFVVDHNSFLDTMLEESKIGFAAGLPFDISIEGGLKPLCGINLDELNIGAPTRVLNMIDSICNEKLSV